MQENHLALIEAYTSQHIQGTAIINELLRCKALDQILASRPEVAQWGVTLDELWKLAEATTVATFGPLEVQKADFGRLYQQAFSVNIMEFIEDTDYMGGIRAGLHWKTSIEQFLVEAKNSCSERILFAHIEEYAAMVEDILQSLPQDSVVLIAGTKEAFEIFSKLYPLANIQQSWPETETFNRIFSMHTDCFDAPELGLQEYAYYGDTLAVQGKGTYFISNRAVLVGDEISQKAAQLLWSNYRVAEVTEWLPYGVYEYTIDSKTHDKITLSIKERLDTDEIKRTKLIPLRHELIAELEPFTMAKYILACGGFDLALYTGTIPMGAELVFSNGVEPTFGDPNSAALWSLFRESEIGQCIYDTLRLYVQTEEGLFQLLESISRPSFSTEIETELADQYWAAAKMYEEEVQEATQKWEDSKKMLLQKMNL